MASRFDNSSTPPRWGANELAKSATFGGWSDIAVHPLEAVDMRGDRELGALTLLQRCAQLAPAPLVSGELAQLLRAGDGITRLEEQAGRAERLAMCAAVRRHDRCCLGHGLDNRESERLGGRRRQQHRNRRERG